LDFGRARAVFAFQHEQTVDRRCRDWTTGENGQIEAAKKCGGIQVDAFAGTIAAEQTGDLAADTGAGLVAHGENFSTQRATVKGSVRDRAAEIDVPVLRIAGAAARQADTEFQG